MYSSLQLNTDKMLGTRVASYDSYSQPQQSQSGGLSSAICFWGMFVLLVIACIVAAWVNKNNEVSDACGSGLIAVFVAHICIYFLQGIIYCVLFCCAAACTIALKDSSLSLKLVGFFAAYAAIVVCFSVMASYSFTSSHDAFSNSNCTDALTRNSGTFNSPALATMGYVFFGLDLVQILSATVAFCVYTCALCFSN